MTTYVTAQDLPEWVSHKVVRAAKIINIFERRDGMALDLAGAPGLLLVEADWCERFRPEVGGYYVGYEDGYASFSPAKAFEDGYTRKEG